jgi:Tfp pilus assembly protein PilF
MTGFRLTLTASLLALVTVSCSSELLKPRQYPPAPRPARTAGPAAASSAQFESGLRMYEKGRYRQAAKMFRQALRHNPANYRAAAYLGMCHMARGRHNDARNSLRLALELAPDAHTAARIHAGLGYGYEMERHFARAHEHYRLALTFDSEYDYAARGKKRTAGN